MMFYYDINCLGAVPPPAMKGGSTRYLLAQFFFFFLQYYCYCMHSIIKKSL